MGVRHTYTASIGNVGSALLDGTVIVPFRGLIHRCNFFVSAGSNIAQVRGQIGTVVNATGNDVLLKYSLSPLDPVATPTNQVIPGLLSSDEPGIFYEVTQTTAPAPWGILHWQAAVDDVALDHTVNLALVIEDQFAE